MSIEYGRKVKGIDHTVEVTATGGATIELSRHSISDKMVCLDFEELERIYNTALEHRDACKTVLESES